MATKKPANGASLSKQDKVLVEAQLAKESQIRSRVENIKTNLERGLQLIRSVVESNPPEFQGFVASITSLLLTGAVKHGALLVGDDVFHTYVVSIVLSFAANCVFQLLYRHCQMYAPRGSGHSRNGLESAPFAALRTTLYLLNWLLSLLVVSIVALHSV